MSDRDLYNFEDIQFRNVMHNRITKVLVLCSNYDAFLLQEDGRIEEHLFNEYSSLNLRYPPTFIYVTSYEEAISIMETGIDLIIFFQTTESFNVFESAKLIKAEYSSIPIVVLTYLTKENYYKLLTEDVGSIDYIFSWLGDADLILAIIKLIEDSMNAQEDILQHGVQVILFIEDSVKYYSSYLPVIYRIMLQQSKAFRAEGLNKHEQNLMMRGRPKVLLARNYEEAMEYFNCFENNILGIISDVKFQIHSVTDSNAGIKFIDRIKKRNRDIPILLQSFSADNKDRIVWDNVYFLHKTSIKWRENLSDFFFNQLAFGDFIFIDPNDNSEIGRAADLHDFQEFIHRISDQSLRFHQNSQSFSRWLRARALFSLAELFSPVSYEDFPHADDLRKFILHAISSFRKKRGEGVIAQFNRDQFDNYTYFARIGSGSLGGKARGLAFIQRLLKRKEYFYDIENIVVEVPKSIVLCSDVFTEFIDINNIDVKKILEIDDKQIFEIFNSGDFPNAIKDNIYAFITNISKPVAVRSSSVLEDSYYRSFAGVYATYLIGNTNNSNEFFLGQILSAIKGIYASVFIQDSQDYRNALPGILDEEKMSVIIQELCGETHDGLFYPTISGVARSKNYYPIEPEKIDDGVANIAFGLGTYVVSGGLSLRFTPKNPKRIQQLANPQIALSSTQTKFVALDMSETLLDFWKQHGNIVELEITAIPQQTLHLVSSVYNRDADTLQEGTFIEGKRLITFSNILKHETFPLAKIINDMLEMGEKEFNCPVEIEFAVDMSNKLKQVFNFLQIRPFVKEPEMENITITTKEHKNAFLFSTQVMGNLNINSINSIVYVDIKKNSYNSYETYVAEIEKINNSFKEAGTFYILIGPGRWGSSDPKLGIPVRWTQISQARVVVEVGNKDVNIDPSYGTHFFHNLVNAGVGYMSVNEFQKKGFINVEQLVDNPDYTPDISVLHFNCVAVKISTELAKGIIIVNK